jgi:hypothetical protein
VKRISSFGDLAFLKDLFSSVNNRVNGFERVLARRSKEFRLRGGNKAFPHRSGCGPQEMARRVRQMERNAASQARRDAYWGAQ